MPTASPLSPISIQTQSLLHIPSSSFCARSITRIHGRVPCLCLPSFQLCLACTPSTHKRDCLEHSRSALYCCKSPQYISPYYYSPTACNLQHLDARHCQAQSHGICHLISLASVLTLANPYHSANRERAVRHCSKHELLRILIPCNCRPLDWIRFGIQLNKVCTPTSWFCCATLHNVQFTKVASCPFPKLLTAKGAQPRSSA